MFNKFSVWDYIPRAKYSWHYTGNALFDHKDNKKVVTVLRCGVLVTQLNDNLTIAVDDHQLSILKQICPLTLTFHKVSGTDQTITNLLVPRRLKSSMYQVKSEDQHPLCELSEAMFMHNQAYQYALDLWLACPSF